MAGWNFVRGPRERQTRLGGEFRILARERIEDRPDFPRRVIAGFPRQRSPFHLQPAAIGIAAQFPSAIDDRRVQRRRSHQRMRRPRLQLAIERLEPLQHTPHAHDRVAAVAGTAAVRGTAARLDLEPGESLVGHADLQIGRFGHDGKVGLPPADQRVGADTRVLLVDDGGDDQTAAREKPRSAATRAASIIAATPAFMSCAPRP